MREANRRHWGQSVLGVGAWSLLKAGGLPISSIQAATEGESWDRQWQAAARNDFDELYTPQVERAIDRGLKYLASRRTQQGGFQTQGWGRNVGVCGIAGMALMSRGYRPGDGVVGDWIAQIGAYLLGQAEPSGYLPSPLKTNHGPMYEHGFATLFLAELYGMAPQLASLRPSLQAAVDLLVRTQNDQGGWRYEPRPKDADLSVTVCQIMALRAARNAGLGVPRETIDRATEYVRRSQNPDGGFMYQWRESESRMALTAAALVSLYNLGISEGEEIEKGFQYLDLAITQNRPGGNYFFYAYYYAVQAYWHRGGQAWSDNYTRLRNLILPLQRESGAWEDPSSTEYGTAMALLILQVPRTVLPIFQR
jgi:hypothetical protein